MDPDLYARDFSNIEDTSEYCKNLSKSTLFSIPKKQDKYQQLSVNRSLETSQEETKNLLKDRFSAPLDFFEKIDGERELKAGSILNNDVDGYFPPKTEDSFLNFRSIDSNGMFMGFPDDYSFSENSEFKKFDSFTQSSGSLREMLGHSFTGLQLYGNQSGLSSKQPALATIPDNYMQILKKRVLAQPSLPPAPAPAVVESSGSGSEQNLKKRKVRSNPREWRILYHNLTKDQCIQYLKYHRWKEPVTNAPKGTGCRVSQCAIHSGCNHLLKMR